jgi:hypothetical protein
MKPKTNRAGETSRVSGYDCCGTPAYALTPLLPYLPKHAVIWESACGNGLLTQALTDAGYTVIGTDLQEGVDFFDWQPPRFDVIVTNPPYSIKYRWLERCYQLGRPFALLIPVESIGAAAAQAQYRRYGTEWLMLDKRVDFVMPRKGAEGSSAQFPVFWSCWRMLSDRVVWGTLVKPSTRKAKVTA